MANEYLEAFEELQDKNTFKGQQWFGEREDLVEKYSWAVPNDEVIRYLSEFDEIVEAGAGSGYWAYLLEDQGVTVEAFDVNPPAETWTHVRQASARDMYHSLKNEAVLIVWPPRNSMAWDAINPGPSHVLYVGEKRGGCTAKENFFDRLEKEYGLVGRIELPSYAGVNDDFYHYVRNL